MAKSLIIPYRKHQLMFPLLIKNIFWENRSELGWWIFGWIWEFDISQESNVSVRVVQFFDGTPQAIELSFFKLLSQLI